jgi:hypothetical protein
MNAEKMARCAMGMAEMALADSGKVRGQVFLHAGGRIAARPYKDCKPEELGAQQDEIIAVIRMTRLDGTFEGVVLVSEAWQSEPSHGAIAEVLRPALDPDRKEIVIAWAYDPDGNKVMTKAELIRKDGKVSIGEPETFRDGFKSWLDEAFE